MVANFEQFSISPDFIKILGKVTKFQRVRSKAMRLMAKKDGGGGGGGVKTAMLFALLSFCPQTLFPNRTVNKGHCCLCIS